MDGSGTGLLGNGSWNSVTEGNMSCDLDKENTLKHCDGELKVECELVTILS